MRTPKLRTSKRRMGYRRREEGQGRGPGRREQEEGEREKRVGGPGEDPLPPLRDPKASEMGVEDTGSLKTGAFIFLS